MPADHSRDVPPHTHGGTDAPECTTCRPLFGTEEYRQWAVLFNDLTRAPLPKRPDFYLDFSVRHDLADYLFQQGWRRDIRAEDVTERG